MHIHSFTLGPLQNNTYLLVDPDSGSAVVVDPSFDCDAVLQTVYTRAWQLTEIWLTHAHFDHIAGVARISQAFNPNLPVRLHPADLELWRQRGGADLFGLRIETGPEPGLLLQDGETLQIGGQTARVHHTPGHSLGHVVYHLPGAQAVCCGDLIFQSGVGRVDLPGGSYTALMHSIEEHILSLPDDTRLLPGHGPETTVGIERVYNPFLDQ